MSVLSADDLLRAQTQVVGWRRRYPDECRAHGEPACRHATCARFLSCRSSTDPSALHDAAVWRVVHRRLWRRCRPCGLPPAAVKRACCRSEPKGISWFDSRQITRWRLPTARTDLSQAWFKRSCWLRTHSGRGPKCISASYS
jgi:hypothetical protein